jgi:hypothetical protein
MNKPECIKKIEDENKEMFSVVNLDELIDKKVVDSLDKNKNLTIVHMDADFTLGTLKYNSKLYKTSNGIYIYCKSHLGIGWDNKEVSVYHKPENINEVIIFLKQLIKK